MIELEEIPVAFGESAVSEVGNDPDHKSSESSELSSAPSVPHYNISVSLTDRKINFWLFHAIT